ncbi:MAG: glutamate--tRNA ligase, partial [Rhodospirillaceae bacterium]
MSVTVRFAPSPTGYLHLGNARMAVLNALFALQQGGQFVLRIDDTDQARSTPEYEDAIREDLSWLGITWQRQEKQSDRTARYEQAVAALKEARRLYACWETAEELDYKRRRQRARGLPPVYDRAGLEVTAEQKAQYEAEGRTPHWRFKLDAQTESWDDVAHGAVKIDCGSVSDPVLVRADGTLLYTLP